MSKEKLNLLIQKLEDDVSKWEDKFASWHEEIETEGYAIAGDFFGHSDDCFEAGIRYGKGVAQEELLDTLKGWINA